MQATLRTAHDPPHALAFDPNEDFISYVHSLEIHPERLHIEAIPTDRWGLLSSSALQLHRLCNIVFGFRDEWSALLMAQYHGEQVLRPLENDNKLELEIQTHLFGPVGSLRLTVSFLGCMMTLVVFGEAHPMHLLSVNLSARRREPIWRRAMEATNGFLGTRHRRERRRRLFR